MARIDSTESLSNVSSKFCSPLHSNSPSFSVIGACLVNITFALGGAFLNSLVIFVFLYSSLLRSKMCYFLVMVLSCIDLVVVFISHPLAILYSISELTGNNVCVYEKLYQYLGKFVCALSANTLLAMNIERYFAIVHPYFYQRTVTKQKLLLLVGFFWIFTLTSWLFAFYFTIMKRMMIVGTIIYYFLFTVPIYGRILIIARKKRQQRFVLPTCSFIPPEQSICKYKEHLREVKFASMYILFILCTFVCYCPALVAYAGKYIETRPCKESTTSVNKFRFWLGTVAAMNSTFNCIIFFWRNKTLRNEGKKLMTCFQAQTIRS